MSEIDLLRKIADIERELNILKTRELYLDGSRRYGSGIAASYWMRLPMLRGYWPMTIYDASSVCMDIGPEHMHFTDVNNVYFFNNGGHLSSSRFTSGSSTYLTKASEDNLNITGNETFVTAALRGLTIGCWIWMVSLPSATQFVAARWNSTGNQRHYVLHVNSSNRFSFAISGDGVNGSFATSTVDAVISQWYFVVGRYTRSVPKLDLFVDRTKYTNTTSIPTTIYSGAAAPFRLGASGVPGDYLDAYMTQAFLCAAALPDAVVLDMYNSTRALFGK